MHLGIFSCLESFFRTSYPLSGGGPNWLGFDALYMDLTGRGFASGRLERYEKLCYVAGSADKVARFLIEFHAEDYEVLQPQFQVLH